MKPLAQTVAPIAMALTVSAVIPANAHAQDIKRGETVVERARPETEPLGVRVGPFTVFPRLETGLTYDDNVYATESNTKSDLIWTIRPEFRARSDFARHSLNLTAAATIGRYADQESENYTDYRLEADGRVEATRDNLIDYRLFYRRDHEGRGDPNVGSALSEPVVYDRAGGELSYTRVFGRIRGQVFGRFDRYAYDNATLTDGTPVREEDRDRWEAAGGVRAGYELTPGYEAFTRLTYRRVLYDNTPDSSGRNRSSWGYEAVAGASFDITGLLTGEAFAGYLGRQYTDPALKDYGGLGFGARVEWSPTPLTTVSARLTRELEETTTESGGAVSSGFTRTLVGVRVDHELLRPLLLNARLQWRDEDYDTIARTDDILTAGFGATYAIGRNIVVGADYTFEKLYSDANVQEYSSNIVTVRFAIRL
jgi:hypothetical protein